MTSKRFLSALVAMTLTLLLTVPAHTASKDQIKSFEGITGMEVEVARLDEDIKEKIKLDENQIRVDTELKLRMAGIKVLSREEGSSAQEPFLYVNVSVDKPGDSPIFYYSIRIEFWQIVYLEQKPILRLFAPTWQTSRIGSSGKYHAPEEIRNRVKDELDKFINDYLSVNPSQKYLKFRNCLVASLKVRQKDLECRALCPWTKPRQKEPLGLS